MKATLYDVIDTRNGQHYSVVVVNQNKARFFIPANDAEEEY